MQKNIFIGKVPLERVEFYNKHYKKPPCVTKCLWFNSNISDDAFVYALHHSYVNFPVVYVFKESDEGNSLKEWLHHDDNRTNEKISEKVLEYLCNNLEPDELIELIKIIQDKA